MTRECVGLTFKDRSARGAEHDLVGDWRPLRTQNDDQQVRFSYIGLVVSRFTPDLHETYYTKTGETPVNEPLPVFAVWYKNRKLGVSYVVLDVEKRLYLKTVGIGLYDITLRTYEELLNEFMKVFS